MNGFPPWWTPPREVRVNGTRYPVRRGSRGSIEIQVAGSWQTQDTFPVYDDASLQMTAENLIHRHESRASESVGRGSVF